MIEPSSGRPTMSGPGTPLLLGIAATAALLVSFLIGFQLGSGEDRVRTVIVGASPLADAAAAPSSGSVVDGGGRIRKPRVANELQQAYYANLRLGEWVVCGDGASLRCQPAAYQSIDGDRVFDPLAHLPALPMTVLTTGPRIYLAGNLESVWLGTRHGSDSLAFDRLLGVTLNGSVQYFDLGDLATGDYVILNRSSNAFDRGPATFAMALRIHPAA